MVSTIGDPPPLDRGWLVVAEVELDGGGGDATRAVEMEGGAPELELVDGIDAPLVAGVDDCGTDAVVCARERLCASPSDITRVEPTRALVSGDIVVAAVGVSVSGSRSVPGAVGSIGIVVAPFAVDTAVDAVDAGDAGDVTDVVAVVPSTTINWLVDGTPAIVEATATAVVAALVIARTVVSAGGVSGNVVVTVVLSASLESAIVVSSARELATTVVAAIVAVVAGIAAVEGAKLAAPILVTTVVSAR